ncbi:hypothetical protein M0805_007350 [Coniferiporia weirii]|nr:hypothetical protein M0805_007350 [Coniferiporia weirii]
MPQPESTQGKPVIVVTGGSKGIGLAVVTALLESFGAIVVSVSRSRSSALIALLQKHPSTLLTIEADATDEPAVRAAISLVLDTYRHIDALVLNAGVLEPLGRIGAPGTTTDSWREHFELNFFSLLYTVQAALPALRESGHGGRIVFISSGAAVSGTPAWGVYNASKAAMNSFCRTLANEEPDVVSVALRPGMVDTSMQETLRTVGPAHLRRDDMNRFVKAHSEGTLVKPDDVGHVVASLSLAAPKALSGMFVSWDSEECKDFRRV